MKMEWRHREELFPDRRGDATVLIYTGMLFARVRIIYYESHKRRGWSHREENYFTFKYRWTDGITFAHAKVDQWRRHRIREWGPEPIMEITK